MRLPRKKRCPFCGCKPRPPAQIEQFNPGYQVECMGCYAIGPWSPSKERAIIMWNKGCNK